VAYNRLTGSMGRYAARVETFIDEFLTVLERQSTRKTSPNKR